MQKEPWRDGKVGARPGGNFKRLTETEMQEKRAKGLCFRCDEKFTPGHRCNDRTLQVLTVYDEEEDDMEEKEEEEEEHLHLDVAEVSLNSVVGFTPNHTMKVLGKIKGEKVTVLVDSGATHNFISNQVVEKLKLERVNTGGFRVMMGSSQVEKSRGICKGVKLTLREIQVIEDFLPLELGSTDVILSMK